MHTKVLPQHCSRLTLRSDSPSSLPNTFRLGDEFSELIMEVDKVLTIDQPLALFH